MANNKIIIGFCNWLVVVDNVQFQKISILPLQKGLEFPSWRVGGSVRPTNLRKCVKVNRNFQRGGGNLEKFPSVGEV